MSFDRQPPRQKQGKPTKDKRYLNAVRHMDCCTCGRHAPSEAHHCRDLPDFAEQGLYDFIPGAGMKSADRDAIPLCGTCHWTRHNRPLEFQRLYGKDYGYIAPTRAHVSDMEIDF